MPDSVWTTSAVDNRLFLGNFLCCFCYPVKLVYWTDDHWVKMVTNHPTLGFHVLLLCDAGGAKSPPASIKPMQMKKRERANIKKVENKIGNMTRISNGYKFYLNSEELNFYKGFRFHLFKIILNSIIKSPVPDFQHLTIFMPPILDPVIGCLLDDGATFSFRIFLIESVMTRGSTSLHTLRNLNAKIVKFSKRQIQSSELFR